MQCLVVKEFERLMHRKVLKSSYEPLKPEINGAKVVHKKLIFLYEIKKNVTKKFKIINAKTNTC
jgi:hypothetical protein